MERITIGNLLKILILLAVLGIILGLYAAHLFPGLDKLLHPEIPM